MYYQRILASQDKSLVAAEIQTTEPKPEYEKIIKDPYVMEFLQIQPDTHVYEGELEQALIDHLQHFLLELGRGFSFVAVSYTHLDVYKRQMQQSGRTYIAIDLKSYYASVECMERGLDPMTTNLVVADLSRTEKTICLAVSPSLKAYGISGRARLFEVVERVKMCIRDSTIPSRIRNSYT